MFACNQKSSSTLISEVTTELTTINLVSSSIPTENIAVHIPEAGINDFVSYQAVYISNDSFDAYIDVNISEDESSQMIESISEIIDKLPSDHKLVYRISDNFGSWIDNDIITLNKTNFYLDNNYVNFTLLYLFGESSNYGLIYGYSQYLLDQSSVINLSDLTSLTNNDDYVFDLTWPLFLSEYVTDEIGVMVRSISTNFVSYLINTEGEEVFQDLLTQSGTFNDQIDNSLASYLSEWLYSLGIVYQVSPMPIVIRYSTASSYYPVIIETMWAKYYINKDFMNEQFDFDVVFTDYYELRSFINTLEYGMEQVREFTNNDLSIDLYGKIPIYYNSIYGSADLGYGALYRGSEENSSIVARAAGATLHEYVHYATLGTKYKDTSALTNMYLLEGIAIYVSTQYDDWWEKANQYEYENILPSMTSMNEFVMKYNTFLLENQIQFDVFDYMDFTQYTFIDTVTFPNFVSSASYVKYLIDNYGIELFWQYYGEEETFDVLYGKSSAEMQEEWKQYLIDKFE